MIPQEKSAAVTRGLCEASGVTAFEDIQSDPRPQFGSRLSHRRARTSIPIADHHAYRRSYAPIHMHEAGCRSRSCAEVWTPA